MTSPINIKSCADSDGHSQHHWESEGATFWCPGAVSAPKQRFVVTVHSGGGSTVEAADPQGAWLFASAAEAQAVAEGLNQHIGRSQDRYIREEYWAIWFEIQEPPKASAALLASEGVTPGPKQIAIDLKAMFEAATA